MTAEVRYKGRHVLADLQLVQYSKKPFSAVDGLTWGVWLLLVLEIRYRKFIDKIFSKECCCVFGI